MLRQGRRVRDIIHSCSWRFQRSTFCTSNETENENIMSEIESNGEESDLEKDPNWAAIGNNSTAKEVHNLIKEGKTTYFTGVYHNLLCLYRSLKKKTSLSESPPYHKTKAELFQFMQQRRVLQRDTLNKLLVQIDRSNVKAEALLKDVKGSDKAIRFPKLPLDMQFDPSLVGLDQSGAGFTSYHFLMAYRSCYQRKVRVKELGKDAELEVGFGVFPPTRKDYIRLFDSIFSQWCMDNRRSIHQKAFPLTILDVGCGSGVLGFIALKHLKSVFTSPSLRAYLLGVDQYHEAIRCCTASASRLDVDKDTFFLQSSELFPILEDVPNSVRKRPVGRHVKALQNNQYDVIVCNPPWLPTDINMQEKDEIVSFSESYVYDEEKNNFVGRFLSEAANHLKKDGRIFLIHSNLGHLLGLYEENYIPLLCEANGLQVKSIFETNARVKFTEKDWFAQEKSSSKVFLYEITHQTTDVVKQEPNKFMEQYR